MPASSLPGSRKGRRIHERVPRPPWGAIALRADRAFRPSPRPAKRGLRSSLWSRMIPEPKFLAHSPAPRVALPTFPGVRCPHLANGAASAHEPF